MEFLTIPPQFEDSGVELSIAVSGSLLRDTVPVETDRDPICSVPETHPQGTLYREGFNDERGNVMRFLVVAMMTVAMGMALTGCDLLESGLSNIDGWDLSACVDGFATCQELFFDNRDRIDGGLPTVETVLAPFSPAPK